MAEKAEDVIGTYSTVKRPRLLLTVADFTLNNPDTLTKYKTAAQISHKVLEIVTGK